MLKAPLTLPLSSVRLRKAHIQPVMQRGCGWNDLNQLGGSAENRYGNGRQPCRASARKHYWLKRYNHSESSLPAGS